MSSKLLRQVASWLPPSLVGAVDYRINPRKLDGFGGPFNGQCFRQLVVVDLLSVCHFEAIVETGTFVGSTTLFFAHNCTVPVYSAEISPRYFQLARRRLGAFSHIHLYNMDSITVLPLLPLLRTTRTFFYLDAHWYDHLPLAEETEFIFSNFDHFVVMVDDFQVPEDSGYKFDDYGPGRTLTLKDFPFDRDARVSTYFPARNSNQESGRRRGCAVLASQSMTPVVDRLDCLVRHRFQTDASWGCGS